MRKEEKWIPLGKLGRAKGLKGEMYADFYDPRSEALMHVSRVLLGDNIEGAREFHLESVKPMKSRHVIRFKECTRVEEARDLTGLQVFVSRSELPPLKEGEYYICDLEGFKVRTDDGEELGIVTGTLLNPGNDILMIRSASGVESLVPLVPHALKEVDGDEEIITVAHNEVVRAN